MKRYSDSGEGPLDARFKSRRDESPGTRHITDLLRGTPSKAERSTMSATEEIFKSELDNKGIWYRNGWPRLPPPDITGIRRGIDDEIGPRRRDRYIEWIGRILKDDLHVEGATLRFEFRPSRQLLRKFGTLSREEKSEFFSLVIELDMHKVYCYINRILWTVRQKLMRTDDTRTLLIEVLDRQMERDHWDMYKTSSDAERDAAWSKAWRSFYRRWHCTYRHQLIEDCLKWTDIEFIQLCRKGYCWQMSRPTVVLCSLTAYKDRWWIETLPKVRAWLAENDLFMDVELEQADGTESAAW
ncbi:hypothetical protein BU24DRAFT_461017 [Aaosphaeria arxii CBS 175.79]|uniref:Uncharacterized protein n=1 Tax=Aaosphaeria arxii CBS 175.79 TaxID=1450172 RepID=A0A6A5XXK6_9PLEO|nr:uncharacterized protein BU24DRAFT_461017 [Aaosphaeria arxii CBS 175.79]KAF2018038.1 hypothetical protein BU24DRAFT_461017 [Aaosphaeria arxii CBS 175.79]